MTPSNGPEILEVLNSPGLVALVQSTSRARTGQSFRSAAAVFGASGGARPALAQGRQRLGNARKQRHHQAVELEILYYPQAVREDMGPTATIPYSHYWTFDHEENNDNFAGPDHMDFTYMLG